MARCDDVNASRRLGKSSGGNPTLRHFLKRRVERVFAKRRGDTAETCTADYAVAGRRRRDVTKKPAKPRRCFISSLRHERLQPLGPALQEVLNSCRAVGKLSYLRSSIQKGELVRKVNNRRLVRVCERTCGLCDLFVRACVRVCVRARVCV